MKIEKVSYVTAHTAMHKAMEDHWNEVPFGPFHMPLSLDHDAYMVAEDEGFALFYLVHIDNKPVAYMSVLASEMTQHKGVMQAVTDAFYVSPDYRKGGVFGKLLTFVEQDLKDYDIRFFTVGTNVMYKGDTGPLLTSVGYSKTEVLYTKEL